MSDYTREEVIEMVQRGESLEGADLSGIDLSQVDFRSKEYGGPCEKVANLSKTNLSNANLMWSKLSYSKLVGTKLYSAIVVFAHLCGVDLSNACLAKAFFTGTNFNASNLVGANLSNAHLMGTQFQSANLNMANLSKAGLDSAIFRDTILTNSILTNTNLASVDFEDANLDNADISGANIYHIKTPGWKIDGVKCSHIYLCPENYFKKLEKHRRNPKQGEDFESFVYRILDKTQRLRAKEGWKPTEVSKKLTKQFVYNCLKDGCTCNDDELRNFLSRNFEDRKPPFESIISLQEYNATKGKKRKRDFMTTDMIKKTVKLVFKDNGLEKRVKGCNIRGAYSASHDPCPIHSK